MLVLNSQAAAASGPPCWERGARLERSLLSAPRAGPSVLLWGRQAAVMLGGEELGSEPSSSTSVAVLSCVSRVTSPQLGFCSGLNGGPKERCPRADPWDLCIWPHLEKRSLQMWLCEESQGEVIADYVCGPTSNGCIRPRGRGGGNHGGGRPCEDGGGDWNDGATSQGCQEPPGAGRVQKGSPPRASGEVQPCRPLDLGLLASGATSFRCFKPPVSGTLVRRPQDTDTPSLSV